MGRENSGKAKVVITDNLKVSGNLKGMYYFLIGVSTVIPVLFMLKLLYIDVISVDGAVATHTQYYLWNSPWLIGKIFRETADGRFFTLATLIPLGMVIFALINCVTSIMKAFTEKISWKHAEACNHACSSMIVAVLAMLLIFKITDPFFNIESGFSGQDLTFNVVIYIILGVAIIGKIVAHYYFKEVRSKQLF
jgi:hypothetical protein